VYGRDWEFKPITVPPNEAQFIEAQQLTATQIASVYGVMPRKAGGIHGDSMTYSNVAQDQLNEVTETLDPWLVRFEQVLTRCLPAAQSVSFNRDARIRYDLTARYNAYQVARNTGFLNVDDICELEDRPPLPKPKDDNGYDGTDYTPLSIQVAAARGMKSIPGEGAGGGLVTAPAAKPGPGLLASLQPHAPVPAANGNGKANGQRPARA
jgi:hypothetical protein